jgi:predicted dehydrogenase
MLANSHLDALVIATPAQSHFDCARYALNSGLHVLCEKPLTLSSHHAVELVRLADKRKRTLMVDHTQLFSPAFSGLSNLIATNELGNIYSISCQRKSLGRFQSDSNVVWDLAPHDLSILCHLFKELPNSLSCHARSTLGGPQEDVASLSLSFSNNRSATIENSWAEPNKVREVTIVGSRGIAVFDDQQSSEKLRIFSNHTHERCLQKISESIQKRSISGDYAAIPLQSYEPLWQMCQHFVTCCLTDRIPISSGSSAAEIIRLLEAADSSSEQDGRLLSPFTPCSKTAVHHSPRNRILTTK